MKEVNTFWIVVGILSLLVLGGCITVALILSAPKVMWGLLLMPILWAQTTSKGKKKNKKTG